MSAERLREAAALMRSRAVEATPSPWHTKAEVHDYAMGGVQVRHDATDGHYTTAVAPMVWQGSAEHIASWHPAVALVVADWLDRVAGDADDQIFDQYSDAMPVANAYLGTAS